MRLLAPWAEAARIFRSRDNIRQLVELGCGHADQLIATHIDAIVGLDKPSVVNWLTVHRTERGDWYSTDFGFEVAKLIKYKWSVVIVSGALERVDNPARFARHIKPALAESEAVIAIKPKSWSAEQFAAWTDAAGMQAVSVHEDDGIVWGVTSKSKWRTRSDAE